jgi:phosphonopyruvate decarboxylase
MNLGSLVTIAAAAPPNLFHFVCHNGTYEANGGHPIPGRDRVDFCGFARSAGYPRVHEFSALSDFEQQIGALLSGPGPVFADLKMTSSGPQERDYSRLHGPHVRQAFRAALATG